MTRAYIMGAEKRSLSRTPENGEKVCQNKVINYEIVDAGKALKEMTGSRGFKGNTPRLSYFST